MTVREIPRLWGSLQGIDGLAMTPCLFSSVKWYTRPRGVIITFSPPLARLLAPPLAC